jgi:hypothetical protein
MDTNKPNAACAATTDFGLRREAKRHAAFERNRPYGKRCRRCALPPQFKSLSSVREPVSLYYGWVGRAEIWTAPAKRSDDGAFEFGWWFIGHRPSLKRRGDSLPAAVQNPGHGLFFYPCPSVFIRG